MHRFIRFSIVGLSGVIVNLGLLYLLVQYGHLDKYLAWFIAVMISIFSNYVLNSIFTYPDRRAKTGKALAKRAAYYYIVSLVMVGLNFLIYGLALEWGFGYMESATFGILLSTLVNFAMASELIWRKEFEDTY